MNAKPAERERALAFMRERPELSAREIAREIGVDNKTVSRWRAEAGIEEQPSAAPPLAGNRHCL